MYRKLSVIMPVYNEVHTVERVVKRLLDVGIKVERELIIVDDASSDGTWRNGFAAIWTLLRVRFERR